MLEPKYVRNFRIKDHAYNTEIGSLLSLVFLPIYITAHIAVVVYCSTLQADIPNAAITCVRYFSLVPYRFFFSVDRFVYHTCADSEWIRIICRSSCIFTKITSTGWNWASTRRPAIRKYFQNRSGTNSIIRNSPIAPSKPIPNFPVQIGWCRWFRMFSLCFQFKWIGYGIWRYKFMRSYSSRYEELH